MKLSFYILLVIVTSSCKSIILNTMIKDARVENTTSIKNFQLDHHFDTSNSFIVKADTATAMHWIEKGIATYEIYNKKGELIDFIGTTECGATVFDFFLEGKLDSFNVDSSSTLQKVLSNCYNYQNKPVVKEDLPQTECYVVVYWEKFTGRKMGYEEHPKFFEDQIKKDTLKKHTITVVKINTDLQESWGMQPKGRMRVKVKVKKDEGDIVFGRLPIKK